MMVKYIVFTEEELDKLKSGTPILASGPNSSMIVYCSEEQYSNMMSNVCAKEFNEYKEG